MNIPSKRRLPQRLLQVIVGMLLISLLAAPGLAGAQAAPKQSYIVMGETTTQVVNLVNQVGGEITSELDIINGAGALLTAEAAAKLAAQPGLSLVENYTMKLNSTPLASNGQAAPAADYADVIGADAAWEAGVTGKGVTVAILDSGIAKFNGLTKNTTNKGNRIVGWLDLVDGGMGLLEDPNGHGTHIAGVIANSQKGSDEEWNGVAPDVNLVIGRVANKDGFASYERVILGITWVVLTKNQYQTRILNFSMSSPSPMPYWMDPVNKALMVAWKSGIVVVAAAGNNGPNALSIGAPGNNPYVITVGAFSDAYTPDDWSDDYIPTFSSAGPTFDGFIKPDIVAPGAHIVSLMDKKSVLAKKYPQAMINNSYATLAGTSQATAVVTGLTALMLQEHPQLTPDQVKYRLRVSSIPQFKMDDNQAGYSVWQQGAGRVFAPTAIFADLVDGNGNGEMDITADLRHAKHYLGYSYRDTEGVYRLFGDDGSWAGGAGVWNGLGVDTRGFWGDTRGFWGDSGYFYATTRGFWGDTRGFWGDGGFWNATRGFWGDTRGFWGDTRGFWGDTRGFWGDTRGFWGDTRGFWGDTVSFFTEGGSYAADRTMWSAGEYFDDPNFETNTRGFWGDTRGFWGDTRGFWGDADFNVDTRGFWGDTRGFWGDTRGFWGDTRGFWGDTRGFWGDTRGFWGDANFFPSFLVNNDD